MATYTIKTRNYGPLTFYCPNDGGYMHLESANRPGTLGRQCCKGGGFGGSTLLSHPDTLAKDAKKWWREARDGLAKEVPDWFFEFIK